MSTTMGKTNLSHDGLNPVTASEPGSAQLENLAVESVRVVVWRSVLSDGSGPSPLEWGAGEGESPVWPGPCRMTRHCRRVGLFGNAAPVGRSGAAVKQGIDIGAGVIDADYRGNSRLIPVETNILSCAGIQKKPFFFDNRNSERICAYASGKFPTVKSAIDAEIHACMEALSALKIHYLDKEEITLRTDCHAIIKFFNKTAQNKPSRVRWISFIDYVTGTGVNIKFEHIEGTNNQLADALSRLVHYVTLNLDDQNELFHVLEMALEETKDTPTKIKDKLASMINSIIDAPVEKDNEGIYLFQAIQAKGNNGGITLAKGIQVDGVKELKDNDEGTTLAKVVIM
ncbi:hypothetical protein ZIOFF_073133 [Zingiber officinale]|uniref:RNase H type-1 domain-containing protein n=1 Tax=Zingiber officinale TaxID=94328 RepID=A0A8J5EM72_ZINOF|nr:hypothetical protein ZIOFF_073133 [Zingiber officinale]